MTSLSFLRTPPFSLMRLMLKDAMLRLSISGYDVVALALSVKHPQLQNLQTMIVFALDVTAIFSGSDYSYIINGKEKKISSPLPPKYRNGEVLIFGESWFSRKQLGAASVPPFSKGTTSIVAHGGEGFRSAKRP
ncbi:hypothetical protein U1Q18_008826 [Sarracenia purpurea var. burkii]